MDCCCRKSNAVEDDDSEAPVVEKSSSLVEKSSSSNLPERPSNIPIREKAVHDILFLAIFIFLIGVMGCITLNALMRGRPEVYSKGYDSWGNVCGMQNDRIPGVEGTGMDRTNHKYIFFTAYSSLAMVSNPIDVFSEKNRNSLPKFCVKQCPNETTFCREFIKEHGYKFSPKVIDELICGVIPNELIFKNKNIHNVCIPDVLYLADKTAEHLPAGSNGTLQDNGTTHMNAALLKSSMTFNLILNSAEQTRNQVAIMAFVTIIICWLSLLVIRLFVKIFVYVTLALSFVMGLTCLVILWYYYAIASGRIQEGYASTRMRDLVKSDMMMDVRNRSAAALEETVVAVKVSEVLANFNLLVIRESIFYLPFCIFATILFVVLLIIFIWARNYIKLAVELMIEACKAIFLQPPILLQPILTCLMYIAVFVFMLVILAYIVSEVIPEVDDNGMVTYVQDPKQLIELQVPVAIFICLAIIFFIKGCHKVIIADVIASYHFSDRTIKQHLFYFLFPAVLPLLRLVRYNLGSVAIGAFALSALSSLSIGISYCKRQLAVYHLNQKYCKKMLDGLQAFVRMLEKVMSFVILNAYICIAIYGYSFCKATKHSIYLIGKHAACMAVVNMVTLFLILLAKFCVLAFVVLVSWLYLTYTVEKTSHIILVVPLILIAIISGLIVQCIFDLFALAIATLFICFCDDQERNEGTEINPYYSSTSLQHVMNSASIHHT